MTARLSTGDWRKSRADHERDELGFALKLHSEANWDLAGNQPILQNVIGEKLWTQK